MFELLIDLASQQNRDGILTDEEYRIIRRWLFSQRNAITKVLTKE